MVYLYSHGNAEDLGLLVSLLKELSDEFQVFFLFKSYFRGGKEKMGSKKK